ncbi:hybrid sensor histidine kinase/response regulator [Pseudomonas savastanoi]|nr:ATP-binding protein [Pseudomonas savastanoi]EFW80209.1 histidine kinase [Pseudomonas savastanoi pv. glycinea str. B076]MCQ3005994.1 ATP-binding protein [Pseudomonas savastanoi]
MAQSPLIESGDSSAFNVLMERVLPLMPNWQSLLMATPDGAIISRVSPHSSAPLTRPVQASSFAQMVEMPGPIAGPLAQGPSGNWAVPLRVPVMRDGELRYVLTAPLLPESISEVLTLSHLPQGWTISVFDDGGRRLARFPPAGFPVGGLVSSELMALVKSGGNEGSGITHTVTGEEVYTAYARIPNLDWTVATGIPTKEVTRKVHQAYWLYGGGLGLSLLLASLGALYASRRIGSPMLQLRNAARDIGGDRIPQLPDTRISEIHEVSIALRDSAAAWKASERARDEALTSLTVAHRELKEADRRKDVFIAILAHELRNPLSAISQAISMLSVSSASEEQRRRSLIVVERQLGHMSGLLENLLDVSRVNLGDINLRTRCLEFMSLLDSVLESMSHKARVKGIALDADISTSKLYLDADELRLTQAFVNLMDNAIKFTPEGGSIKVTVHPREKDVAVVIDDSGIGLIAAELTEIFGWFTKAASPGVDSGGLGIGLALTKHLIELHGGTITVSSPGLGHGTSFVVTLPLSANQLTVEVPPTLPPTPTMINVSRRVLVADDNEDIVGILQELFELEGHMVRVALDGLEAVACCADEMPEVVVMDIGMPNLDGLGAARAIRALPGGDAVVLIAVSGWGQAKNIEDALNAGFDRHISKPADFADLLAIVANAGK